MVQALLSRYLLQHLVNRYLLALEILTSSQVRHAQVDENLTQLVIGLLELVVDLSNSGHWVAEALIQHYNSIA